jgi:hypothetical protein
MLALGPKLPSYLTLKRINVSINSDVRKLIMLLVVE